MTSSSQLRGDSGVTLIELIAAIAISAIIIGAMTGALITSLRTTDSTNSMLAASHDTQLVGTWLQVDVQSAAPTGVSVVPSAPDCPGAGGTNVLRIPYAPVPGDTTFVNYRLESGGAALIRYRCVNGVAKDRDVLASNLASPAPSATVNGSGPFTVTLSLTDAVKTTTGTVNQTVKYSASSRTPNQTIPTFPSPPPPTIPPCTVTSAAATPSPVVMNSPSTLASAVTVTVTARSCVGPLSVSFVPGASGSNPAIVTLAFNGSAWTGTLGASAYTWAPGSKTVTVQQADAGSVMNPTFPLTVSPQPCTTTSFVATPNPVGHQGNGNNSRLAQDVTVTASMSGVCSGLQVDYQPGNPNTDEQRNLNQAGNTWTFVFASSGPGAETWKQGGHTLKLLNTADSVAPTTTLTVN